MLLPRPLISLATSWSTWTSREGWNKFQIDKRLYTEKSLRVLPFMIGSSLHGYLSRNIQFWIRQNREVLKFDIPLNWKHRMMYFLYIKQSVSEAKNKTSGFDLPSPLTSNLTFFFCLFSQYIHSAGIIHRVSSVFEVMKMNGMCPSVNLMCSYSYNIFWKIDIILD